MPGSQRLLDPPSRISEVLFGLIMALTFTGSISAATAGHEEVRTMLYGAIGCNIAWGLVDAVMYMLAKLTERGRELTVARSVRAETDPAAARAILTEAIPAPIDSILSDAELDSIRSRIAQMPEPLARPSLVRDDYLAAFGVFLLVVLSTFPVVIPFILIHQAGPALRVSNAVAIVMLFACGFRLGHYSGNHPWRMGFGMAIIGSFLAGLTMALGG